MSVFPIQREKLQTNLLSYWNADKLVLSMHGAQEVDDHSATHMAALCGFRPLEIDAQLTQAASKSPQPAGLESSIGLLSSRFADRVGGRGDDLKSNIQVSANV